MGHDKEYSDEFRGDGIGSPKSILFAVVDFLKLKAELLTEICDMKIVFNWFNYI